MIDWLIKERISAIVPKEIKDLHKKAVHQASTLGELFLGIVIIKDCESEYVMISRKDFESWYGNE